MELKLKATPVFFFLVADLEDVHPHQNDLVVIIVITMGRNIHKVLVDQGSLTNVMFWNRFKELQVPHDQLKPFEGTLMAFNGGQVEVRGYVDLKTTFTDGQ